MFGRFELNDGEDGQTSPRKLAPCGGQQRLLGPPGHQRWLLMGETGLGLVAMGFQGWSSNFDKQGTVPRISHENQRLRKGQHRDRGTQHRGGGHTEQDSAGKAT